MILKFLKKIKRVKSYLVIFFLFLLLLKFFNNNKNKNLNITVFVKPNFKKVITLLRAPYRYKLSRHQLILSRYYILFNIKTSFNNLSVSNTNDLINLVNLVKTFYVWFESNIVYQHQVKFFLNFNYIKNFVLL